MKNIIALLAIALLFACSSEGDSVEIGEKTTLEVNDVYDAGTVVKGEVIRAVFTVKNTGDHPLVFGEVRPSCSCKYSQCIFERSYKVSNDNDEYNTVY